jgi:hypothetical protein
MPRDSALYSARVSMNHNGIVFIASRRVHQAHMRLEGLQIRPRLCVHVAQTAGVTVYELARQNSA